MSNKVKYETAVGILTRMCKARVNSPVCILEGPVGIGKTAIAAKVAKECDAELITLRITQSEVSDFTGINYVNPVNGALEWARPAVFKNMDPNKMYVVLIDELGQALRHNPAMAAGAASMLWEREIGPEKFGDNVFFIGATNRKQDNAMSGDLPLNLRTRSMVFELEPTLNAWFNWANSEGMIHPYVVKFLQEFPEKFNTRPDPQKALDGFPTSRGWELVSNLLRVLDLSDGEAVAAAVVGTIGQADGGIFCSKISSAESGYSFNLQEIFGNPDTHPIFTDKDPRMMNALINALDATLRQASCNTNLMEATKVFATRQSEEWPNFKAELQLRLGVGDNFKRPSGRT